MVGLSIDIFLNKWKDLFYNSVNYSNYSKNHLKSLLNIKLTVNEYNLFKYFFDKKLVSFVNKNLLLDKINELSLPIDSIRLIFIDGCFSYNFSDNEFIIFNNINVSSYYNYFTAISSDIFLHLIESFLNKIFILNLYSNNLNDKPIYILNITTGLKSDLNVLNYRYHIIVESSSCISIIEHYVSLNNYSHLTCSRFVIEVLNNSYLDHIKILSENSFSYHFSCNDIYIDSSSFVNSTVFLLGSGIIRNNTNVRFNGENGNILLNSLSVPIKSNIFNNYTYVEHNFCNSKSHQLHKIISSAYGKFKGLVKILKNSSKVDATMISRNLLLNDFSFIETEPKLEIYNNDVICTHAATLGKIDENQIFYLCSRGIDSEIAKNIILSSFSHDVIDLIKNNLLRDIILKCINKRLFGDFYESIDY
ncbi:SufD family Fe-S cluster assembly protein [Candidatus Purcelliella pentastirinorum]|uniref:SufD family Fe-S cluster assembly protein n=1 Tax=Candidatus Purcelliella pentastirinorum TaxID=472834 RepID=A0AAX3N9D0_9ENTR|nr:SufD family Fe-S cluster assembly protein [Candidatus Purcelliella pentastirinorum]WDI78614.1 SufD family Fe-S cluster assembly protein [Candidatus Purcelliella pentastirinorum]